MPKNKRPLEPTRSRRQASKEALKQMQLLLDDEDEDAFVIPDDDEDDKDVRLEIPKKKTVSPIIEPPPKKKYKLSHRKSSDGNDRDVIVLKSISNSNYVPKEETLELECFVEELSDIQKERRKKIELEELELQAKLDELMKGKNADVVYKGDFNSAVEVNELISNSGKKSLFKPNQLPKLGTMNEDMTPTYQLVMDPRLGIIVGTVQKNSNQVQMPPPPLTKSKLQISSAVKAVATLPQAQTPPARSTRTRRGAVSTPTTPVQTRGNNATPTRGNNAMPTKANNPIPTRANNPIPTRANNPTPTRANNPTPTRANNPIPTRANNPIPTRGTINTPNKTNNAITTRGNSATPSRAQAPSPSPPAIQTRAMKTTPTVQTRNSKTTPVAKRPIENTSTDKTKQVVDLTSDDSRNQVDNREISFNKLQGKTYPSLVVVARPHLRVSDLGADRSKLDSKVKSVLMHPPTKFTEWLIQQGLIRAEQKCPVHNNNQLKLGMYSDVSKFPFSGGYVWISECCPQGFISVFNGSMFEGSPNPPMVMLKLIYHWSCQTNIQNVTQWVKVDNLYVKGVYTWLRGICTLAVQTRIRQLGGPGSRVEVGVISLGTTSHDGNQRQVKVEVLGILESSSKFMRLRAVEPMPDGDRNFRKKFSKILEPILMWVHPASTIVTDLTVDKTTLHHMGFTNVIQTTSNDYNNSNRTIMEYLRRIVPRMFQNTLSLLSRQIIQQFLDELVWREWFGITAQQAFDNIIAHLAEQTRTNTQPSLIVKLNKVAANPFRSWNGASGIIQAANSTPTPAVTTQVPNTSTVTPVKTPVSEVKRYGRGRKSNSPQVPVVQERPVKPVSPDVPEQMVPLEKYYYGTIESYDSPPPKITLNMKCPFCKSTFDNNLQLQSHLFKHAHNVSNDTYLCRYCLTSVSTANELLYHINKFHPGETKFDNGFVCLICETHYMNPFVLGKHMSKEHSPHELPYECGSCSFRCSNHKQVIDHFYMRHDGGTTIQCPFCLKSTTVWSGGRNIAQNMHYFIQHLQKHQKKQLAKRCGKCNLWFVQKEVLKEHQQKMHVSLRGRLGLVPCSSPRNGVMVPKSKVDKNPCDAEIINFSSLYYNIPNKSMCKECEQVISSTKHFPSFDSCQNPNCQYSTCCATAMMTHNAKCKGLNSIIPTETLPFEMFCVCGHKDSDGNSMAKHLATCEKKSAYPSQADAKSATVMHSMLDILGLVRKPEEAPPPKTKEIENTTVDSAKPKEKRFKAAENLSKESETIQIPNEMSILSNEEQNIQKESGDVIAINKKEKEKTHVKEDSLMDSEDVEALNPENNIDVDMVQKLAPETESTKDDDQICKKANIVELEDEDVTMKDVSDEKTSKDESIDENLKENEIMDQNENIDGNIKEGENTDENLKEKDNSDEILKDKENSDQNFEDNENSDENFKKNESSDENLKENDNSNENLKECEKRDENLQENQNTDENSKENLDNEENLKENENSDEISNLYENTDEDPEANENSDEILKDSEIRNVDNEDTLDSNCDKTEQIVNEEENIMEELSTTDKNSSNETVNKDSNLEDIETKTIEPEKDETEDKELRTDEEEVVNKDEENLSTENEFGLEAELINDDVPSVDCIEAGSNLEEDDLLKEPTEIGHEENQNVQEEEDMSEQKSITEVENCNDEADINNKNRSLEGIEQNENSQTLTETSNNQENENIEIEKDLSNEYRFDDEIQKAQSSELKEDGFQLLNEEGLCKESVSENLHEAALNDILSSTSNDVTPMDVDLESELRDMEAVGAPMDIE